MNKVRYFRTLLVISFLMISCASLPRNNVANKTERVVVLDIVNKASLDKSDLEYLSELMRESVTKLPTKRYSVMTKDNIKVMLPPDQSLQDCQGSCVIDTGRRLGSHWLIHSEIYRFGKSLRVIAKLHHTASGEVKASKALKVETIDQLESKLHTISLHLFGAVDEEVNEISQQAEQQEKAEIAKPETASGSSNKQQKDKDDPTIVLGYSVKKNKNNQSSNKKSTTKLASLPEWVLKQPPFCGVGIHKVRKNSAFGISTAKSFAEARGREDLARQLNKRFRSLKIKKHTSLIKRLVKAPNIKSFKVVDGLAYSLVCADIDMLNEIMELKPVLLKYGTAHLYSKDLMEDEPENLMQEISSERLQNKPPFVTSQSYKVEDLVKEGRNAWKKQYEGNNRSSSLAANQAIDFWEKALILDPNNAKVHFLLSKAYYFMAEFYDYDQTEKQKSWYSKGMRVGEKAVYLQNPKLKEMLDSGEAWSDSLLVVRKSNISGLYWYSCNLLEWSLSQGIMTAMGNKRRLQSIMERLIKLDKKYMYSGPYRNVGIIEAKLPGGNIDEAGKYFDKAIKSSPANLNNLLLKAKYYAVGINNKNLFKRLLKKVTRTNIRVNRSDKELMLRNELALKKAKYLLGKINELF